MSLNWKEIDAVIQELSLEGCFIQNIVQPDFSRLFIEVFHDGGSRWLHICLKPRLTRLHWDRAPARSKQTHRFAELLRARLKGHRVEKVAQIGGERIVRIDARGAEGKLGIVIRLWSNAANILLLDEADVILDAFYRRPGKNETSGSFWRNPSMNYNAETPAREAVQKNFEVREWSGKGFASFESFVAFEYRKKEDELELSAIRERLERLIPQTEARLERKVTSLERQLSEGNKAERFKELGEMILGNKHLLSRGSEWLVADDWYNPGSSVKIELDPKLDPGANAERFFQKFRKSRDARAYIEEDLSVARAKRSTFATIAEAITALTDLESAKRLSTELEPFFDNKGDEQKNEIDDKPGLSFSVRGYPILVGRSSTESDQLLRRYVKGNDYWLHVRDRPGGYVFVKVPKGKSIPLEILLDAATLAVWYSKVRGEPEVDLFYTQVKYLRRAKHGTLGTVIPTQERNIHLVVEQDRLDRLRGLGIS